MKPRFLTILYYQDIGPQHLYKDAGSIPLGLSKYFGWESTFAYVNFNGEIKDREYEKWVRLIPLKKCGSAFFTALIFLLLHGHKYDVLNFYHMARVHLLMILAARLGNPKAKIYIKCDMGRPGFEGATKKGKVYHKIVQVLGCIGLLPDLCTVETKRYVTLLNQLPLYSGRIQYLPNGFWRDERIPTDLERRKENIILTVGRLGTPEKNTEQLLESFAEIPVVERKNWKLLLVGSYTQKILEKAKKMIAADLSLKENIVFTGNIDDKKQLNQYYSKAAIFCLPSRSESFGIVLIEAIHHGCFPIVTDCCDAFYDMLDNGKYGDIVPNENREALTAALRKAMENKAYVVNRGIQGKLYADQYFDWEQIIKKLQNHLADIISKR